MPHMNSHGQTIAVIDFETTGMGPHMGARATEIAVVLVRDGAIVDQYQNLMYTGVWVPPFIEQLTGISNEMLRTAPPAETVMREVAAFTAGVPLVAHNASFDRTFWHAEMARAGMPADPAHEFACTVLLSRRLYPDAPDHKLGTLARHHDLPRDGRAHRAMSDAMVTAHLLLRMQEDLGERHPDLPAHTHRSHSLLCALQRTPKHQLQRCIERLCQAEA
jgi:DNA polymerase-3 subunit epsilon